LSAHASDTFLASQLDWVLSSMVLAASIDVPCA